MPFNYSFQTGIGFEPYLLKTIENVCGSGNSGILKVDNLGFLNLLQSQNKTLNILRSGGNGSIQYATVKFMQRFVENMVGTEDTCEPAYNNPWLEANVPLDIFTSLSVYIEDALMQEYTTDMNQVQSIGAPTQAMGQMVKLINSGCNALLEKLDTQLLNKLVFGVNNVTGSNATSTINFPLSTTNNPLTEGLNEVFAQAQDNQFANGKLQIFGSGLFRNFMLNQPAKTFDQSGLNTVIQAMGVDFFYDIKAQSILGANQFAVVSPDSIQLVEFPRYSGAYGGRKMTSDFGSFYLPMNVVDSYGQVTQKEVLFDFQLKYLDCPSAVAATNDYYGSPNSGYRGWQMIISKTCGLFQLPTNQYRASDILDQTNGIIRFTATNV
jgi:hypothetical protein